MSYPDGSREREDVLRSKDDEEYEDPLYQAAYDGYAQGHAYGWARGHAEGYVAGYMDGADEATTAHCADCGATIPAGQGLQHRGEPARPYCHPCLTKRIWQKGPVES